MPGSIYGSRVREILRRQKRGTLQRRTASMSRSQFGSSSGRQKSSSDFVVSSTTWATADERGRLSDGLDSSATRGVTLVPSLLETAPKPTLPHMLHDRLPGRRLHCRPPLFGHLGHKAPWLRCETMRRFSYVLPLFVGCWRLPLDERTRHSALVSRTRHRLIDSLDSPSHDFTMLIVPPEGSPH